MNKIIAFSEATIIGFHAMVLIAKSGNGLNTQTIAEQTGSSKHHIVKVMQRLAKSHFLTSLRGPNGGFILARNAEEISLLQIYECIEGEVKIPHCHANHQKCPFESCILKDIPRTMMLQIIDFLKNNTLANYCNISSEQYN